MSVLAASEALPDQDNDEVFEQDLKSTSRFRKVVLEVKEKKLSKMKWKKLIILAVVFHVYLILGAGVFHYLESGQEDDTRLRVRQMKEEVLNNYSCIDREVLEEIIDVVVKAANNGINPAGNVTSPSNWDFSSAFFFSGITVTTIGYGHIAPTTRTGQSFCIVFALIGIPACGILLTAIGEKLSALTELAERPFRSKLKQKWQRVLFHLCIIGGSMFVFFITIPAIIFHHIETEWTLHQAWYYCFITVTTIGFGDFVVDQNAEAEYPTIYVVMVYFWILFGLAYLALIIQQIGKILASTGKVVQERVSTTVSTVATAGMATGRVMSDRVSKQLKEIKESIDMNFDSSEDESSDGTPKRKKKPSWRGHSRTRRVGKDNPAIQVTISEEKSFAELNANSLEKSNGVTNGQLKVEDKPDSYGDTESETTDLAMDDVNVEIKDGGQT